MLKRSFSGLFVTGIVLAGLALPTVAHHHGPHENGTLFDNLGNWMNFNQSGHVGEGFHGHLPIPADWIETDTTNRSSSFLLEHWSETARSTIQQLKLMLENFKSYFYRMHNGPISSKMTKPATGLARLLQHDDRIFKCISPEHAAMFTECERLAFGSQNLTNVPSGGSPVSSILETQLNKVWLDTVSKMNHSGCLNRSSVAVNGKVHLVLPIKQVTVHGVTSAVNCAIRERAFGGASCISQCFLRKLRDAHKLDKSANATSYAVKKVIEKSKLSPVQQEKARIDYAKCLATHTNSSLVDLLQELGRRRINITGYTIPIRTNCLLGFKSTLCLLQALDEGCSGAKSAAIHEAADEKDERHEDFEWLDALRDLEETDEDQEDLEHDDDETNSSEEERRPYAQHRQKHRGHGHHHHHNCSSSSTTQSTSAAPTVTVTAVPATTTIPTAARNGTSPTNATTPGVRQPLKMSGPPSAPGGSSQKVAGNTPDGNVQKYGRNNDASDVQTERPGPSSVTAYRYDQVTHSSRKPVVVGVAYRYDGEMAGNSDKSRPHRPQPGEESTDGEMKEDQHQPTGNEGRPAYRHDSGQGTREATNGNSSLDRNRPIGKHPGEGRSAHRHDHEERITGAAGSGNKERERRSPANRGKKRGKGNKEKDKPNSENGEI